MVLHFRLVFIKLEPPGSLGIYSDIFLDLSRDYLIPRFLCRPNVYEPNAIPKYVRGLGPVIKASTEVVKPCRMNSGGSTITCDDSWGNKLLMNGSSY